MKRKVWKDEEVETIVARYPFEHTSSIALDLGLSVGQIYQKANQLNIKKSTLFYENNGGGRFKKGNCPSINTCFKKGGKPWNKGMKGLQFQGSKRTWFKKGHASHNKVEIGTTRLTKDGYLKIKVADPNVWEYVHRQTWEKSNGPIPHGMVVIFRDGNSKNCLLDNLMLISRKDLAIRNSIHRLPEDIKQVIRVTTSIKREIKKHEK